MEQRTYRSVAIRAREQHKEVAIGKQRRGRATLTKIEDLKLRSPRHDTVTRNIRPEVTKECLYESTKEELTQEGITGIIEEESSKIA
jgi:hypothetical protein